MPGGRKLSNMASSIVEAGYPIRDEAVHDASHATAEDRVAAESSTQESQRPELGPARGMALAVVAGAVLWAGIIAAIRALLS